MGTRSLTVFTDEQGEEIAVLYRQFDGYPTGHGQELRDFLAGHTLVNGFSDRMAREFNGMGCLAAAVVARFKTEIGQFYLYQAGTRNVGEEYTYEISPASPGHLGRTERAAIFMRARDAYSGETLYAGPVDGFDGESAEKAAQDNA